MKKYLYIALAAMTIASCGGKKEEAATNTEELTEVKLATVKAEMVPQNETFTATVESDIKNNISPNMTYRIERILVDVGDYVSKGQTVVILDAASLQQVNMQINSQKTNVNNLQVKFNRTAELYKVGGASKADYDDAKVQLEAAQAQLGVLHSQSSQMAQNTQLRAPMSGIVTARNYDNGDMYNGTPILTIEQTNNVKLMLNVSELHYKDLKVGHPVDITLDAYPGESFPGKVSIIHPNIDATTHTFPVEVTITNRGQKVRPGMFARATINFGSLNHVMIPDEALVKQIGAGDRYVYVFDSQKSTVAYKKVELGQHIGTKYEILSGVENGNLVVVAGHTRLANGKKVKVVK